MTRRHVAIALGGALALLALAALVALVALDGMLRRGLETRASALLGTPVTIEHAEVALLEGRAALHGLRVANPPGYRIPHAVTVESVSAELSLWSLLGGPIVIRGLGIAGPEVFVEIAADGRSNLDVIRRHLDGRRSRAAPPSAGRTSAADIPAAPSGTPHAAPSPAAARLLTPRPPAADRRGGRRFIIERFRLERGRVHLDARAAGGPRRSETLEAFELTGLGAGTPGGATSRQLLREIAAAVARDVALSAAASQLERWLGGEVGGPLGDLLRRGGTTAIEQGFGGMLDKLLRREKRER